MGRNSKLETEKGFTLMEAMLTASIAVIVIFAFIKFLPQIPTYFRRLQVQQQIQTDARMALDAMTAQLRNGTASSVQICSCNNDRCTGGANFDPCTASLSVPPNSQINFKTQNGHWHRFYWRSDRALVAEDAANAANNTAPLISILARDVGSITFSGDFRDFSIVDVSLRIDAPLDQSGNPNMVTTRILPTQSVRMISAQ